MLWFLYKSFESKNLRCYTVGFLVDHSSSGVEPRAPLQSAFMTQIAYEIIRLQPQPRTLALPHNQQTTRFMRSTNPFCPGAYLVVFCDEFSDLMTFTNLQSVSALKSSLLQNFDFKK